MYLSRPVCRPSQRIKVAGSGPFFIRLHRVPAQSLDNLRRHLVGGVRTQRQSGQPLKQLAGRCIREFLGPLDGRLLHGKEGGETVLTFLPDR